MYITFKNQYLKELKKIHVCSKAKDLQKFIMEIKMKKQNFFLIKTRYLFYQYEQSHEGNDFIQQNLRNNEHITIPFLYSNVTMT